MSAFTDIDLSALPAPEVVEALDFETILAEMVAELQSLDEEFSALVESDPAFKVLEVAAYRELALRQRVNDAARAVMLAYATGDDLDNLAALVPLTRNVITPGDPDAVPPTEDEMESDADFRRRIALAPEGFSVAGADGAYIFHSLSVSGVKDAAVDSPNPGEVLVHVLALEGTGEASAELVAEVVATLSADDVRPLTDSVSVQSAEIIEYQVEAVLHLLDGPSTDSVEAVALAALEEYVAARHALGLGVAISGVYEALHVAGVQRVALTAPAADITVEKSQAAYCTGITLTSEVGA